MNFSINNKLRKILSLVIALVMLTTLFTGCMKKKPVDNTEPPCSWMRIPPAFPKQTLSRL